MEKILTQKNFDKRIVWLDVVRLVAMFTVVCCHCTDPFNFYPGTSPDIGEIKFWGTAYGALLRPCVPLFVMITGALLLPCTGRYLGVLSKTHPPRVRSLPDLGSALCALPMDNGRVGLGLQGHIGLLSLLGRGGDAAIFIC